MLGMADTLWQRGAGFELHYSARNAAQAAFAGRLQRSPAASRVRFHWSESDGRLDFARLLARAPALSRLYVCGPSAFIQSAVAAAARLGWPSDRLHVESFSLGHGPAAVVPRV
jgi:vanillate monooxygenase ferredoxin subunit